jgi:hypothetical protein
MFHTRSIPRPGMQKVQVVIALACRNSAMMYNIAFVIRH